MLITYLGSAGGRKWEGWEEEVLTFLDVVSRRRTHRPDFVTMREWLAEYYRCMNQKVSKLI